MEDQPAKTEDKVDVTSAQVGILKQKVYTHIIPAIYEVPSIPLITGDYLQDCNMIYYANQVRWENQECR